MRKILLTSAGFENKNIRAVFLELLGRDPSQAKALFVPTAAIDADAIAVLPKCMDDLLDAGIPAENITVYDLHKPMNFEELKQYHAVYFCGGDPWCLLARVNEAGFPEPLRQFVDAGGVYVGVSAGSWIAAQNMPANLGYINCTLDVHQPTGNVPGPIDTTDCPYIKLTNDQAILIRGDAIRVIE